MEDAVAAAHRAEHDAAVRHLALAVDDADPQHHLKRFGGDAVRRRVERRVEPVARHRPSRSESERARGGSDGVTHANPPIAWTEMTREGDETPPVDGGLGSFESDRTSFSWAAGTGRDSFAVGSWWRDSTVSVTRQLVTGRRPRRTLGGAVGGGGGSGGGCRDATAHLARLEDVAKAAAALEEGAVELSGGPTSGN